MRVLIVLLFLELSLLAGEVELGSPEQLAGLPVDIFLHRCVSVGRHIYVIGGAGSAGRVWRASANEEGKLSAWTSATPLPAQQAGFSYHAAVAGSGHVYVLGGNYPDMDGKTVLTPNVFHARVNPDGSLGAWNFTSPLPEPRKGGEAVAHGKRLYYIGGQYHRQVFSAEMQEDGGLSEWREELRMISNRYGGGVVAQDGYLYVIGGNILHGTVSEIVFRNQIGKDGALGKWRRTEPLPAKLGGFATATLDRNVFVLGGYGNNFEKSGGEIRFTRLDDQGHFSAWKNIGKLPAPDAMGFQAVVVGCGIYVIGGIVMGPPNKVLNTVYRIPIVTKGDSSYD